MDGTQWLNSCKKYLIKGYTVEEVLILVDEEMQNEVQETYRLRLEKNNDDGDVGA